MQSDLLNVDDGLLRALVAGAKRPGATPSELPSALPTDVTELQKGGVPGVRVPTNSISFDRDTHPFSKTPALVEHLIDFQSGAKVPEILVGPNDEGGLKVVKGHDSLLAARMLGIPTVKAAPVADNAADATAETAESHFFPKHDTPVMARDANDDSRELPEALEGAPSAESTGSTIWSPGGRTYYPGPGEARPIPEGTAPAPRNNTTWARPNRVTVGPQF